MATGVVNTLTYCDPEAVYNSAGTAVSGLSWTATAKLASVPATTAALTMTEIGSTGAYVPSFTPTAVGVWFLQYSATVDGVTAYFSQSVTVKTAAQADPAASITALYGTAFANLDAAVSSRATVAAITAALATATIAVSSPVALTGDVTVYQGDDQHAADSRSLDWTATNWPDLTSATIALAGQYGANPALTMSATGSVTTPTGASKAVQVELTHAQTAALKAGEWNIQVIATLASGHVVTLVGGTDADPVTMTVVDRVGA